MTGRRADVVLVTGGAGFIGSSIVDRLVESGRRVVVVDDLSSGRLQNLASAMASGLVDVCVTDIRSPTLEDVFAEHRPDVVMHLAAQIDVRASVADPLHDADVNVLGSLNVFERARAHGTRRIVVASSGGCVYGEPRRLPVSEAARGRPVSPYGISKRVLHDYLAFYARTHGISSVVLALSNVYGPRQDPHGEAGVVAIFLGAMLRGQPAAIFGDGRQTRDYVYVHDVADAFVRAAVRGAGVVNIGTGIETSVRALWDACAREIGFRGEPVFRPSRPGELQRSALHVQRARRALGWVPRTSLPDGLSETARFLRDAVRTPVRLDDTERAAPRAPGDRDRSLLPLSAREGGR